MRTCLCLPVYMCIPILIYIVSTGVWMFITSNNHKTKYSLLQITTKPYIHYFK